MTEKGRLTKILLDILDRVKHRGNSTKVNWMNFSNGQAMSRSKFDSIINNYGLPLHDGDLDIIWANIEPNGPNMSYSDFVRFITMDAIDPNKGAKRATTARPSPPPQPTYPDEVPTDSYSSRPLSTSGPRQMKPEQSNSMSGRGFSGQAPPAQPSGNSLLQVLLEYKQQIGNSLLNIDPTFSGFVTAREFEDIIQRIALVNSSEIQRLVSVYDPSNSGYFNYFTLLSDICNQANEQPPARGSLGSSSRASNPSYDDYGSPQRRGAGGPPPGGYDDYGPPRGGMGGAGGGQYDDFDMPPRGGSGNYGGYQKPPSRGMNNYDDFGQTSSPQSSQQLRGNSGGYDDYGAPPSSSQGRGSAGGYGGYDDYGSGAAPPRSSQSRGNSGGYGGYDDYGASPQGVASPSQSSAAPVSSAPSASHVDEIIEKIASRMDNVYDSSQSCYQKWRSYSRVLGPQEFVTGARKDFQIDLTQEEAAAVIARYTTKGHLTMGEFLKMVGAGSDMIREHRRAEAAVALTEDEKVLQHVARQAKNKDWRIIFEQCDSVERTVQSLRTINVYVMLNDLRPCYTKWGKDGVIKKIQAFIDSS